jgi:hypothetical protein
MSQATTLQNTSLNAQAKIHEAASQVVAATAPGPAEPKKNFFQKHGISLGK